MRLMIAGTHSGCGKTTVTLALMAALIGRGLTVAPCKVGPDYIDTGFHAVVCHQPSDNLDPYLCGADAVCSILARAERRAGIAVIEGVMGYYDGMSATDLCSSSYDVARLTRTPVLLVVDVAGSAASAAATVKGFASLVGDSRICGVLVNRVASERHYALVRDAVRHYTDIPCVGWLQKDAQLCLPSRHLGLVPALETQQLQEKLARTAAAMRDTVDIDRILSLAGHVQPLTEKPYSMPQTSPFRLGIARDQAFSFYYEENLRMLKAFGAELVYFSPLKDTALPEGLDALYLGGGFPEVFSETLEMNTGMRKSVLSALQNGMCCFAECGGLMYLSQEIDGREMVGFLPVRCHMTKRLQRFGYVRVTGDSGLTFPAHEFHHAAAVSDAPCVFQVQKAGNPLLTWECGYRKNNVLAGFPHLHFASCPELMERLFR